jgi:hypothetical protein
MTIASNFKDKYFFHLTHLSNLENILDYGLLSTTEKIKRGIEHTNVASDGIQQTRSDMNVTCCPWGKVHDYVPFYFCARTPMLLRILKSKCFEEPDFIFFAVSTKKLDNPNFIFTNKAANRRNEPPQFYDCPSKLSELNWQEILDKKWTPANETAKHEKMAEALHYGQFDLINIDYIVVWNEEYKKLVQRMFIEYGIPCPPIKSDGAHGYYHYFELDQ